MLFVRIFWFIQIVCFQVVIDLVGPGVQAEYQEKYTQDEEGKHLCFSTCAMLE